MLHETHRRVVAAHRSGGILVTLFLYLLLLDGNLLEIRQQTVYLSTALFLLHVYCVVVIVVIIIIIVAGTGITTTTAIAIVLFVFIARSITGVFNLVARIVIVIITIVAATAAAAVTSVSRALGTASGFSFACLSSSASDGRSIGSSSAAAAAGELLFALPVSGDASAVAAVFVCLLVVGLVV